MSFLEGFGTPGGKIALIAFLWFSMFVMIFVVRLMHIEIAPEGLTALSDTSKILLGILIYAMGGGSPPTISTAPKEDKK